jgi:hypothetical protein
MRPRHLLTLAVVGFVVLVIASGYDAFTASNTVAASKVGLKESAFTIANLVPTECTDTITSIKAGSGTFSATATNQLVLGSSSRDVVTLDKNDCFVGGGPTTGTRDKVTGASPAAGNGDECIVNSGATTTRCTVVANRP